MTTKLAEWASEPRQITKIRPSDASGGKTFQRRCNLGMVGADLGVIWEMSVYPTLASAVWPSENTSAIVRNVILALAGTALLTISAKIQVPFYPVPMTMQTFVVLALGMAYGWRLGGATLLLYLAEGAVGLPVFAGTPEKGIGLAYMLGGTGGYLIGFVLAAALCGWLAERGWDRNGAKTALAMLAGNVIIYVPGLLWLGSVFGWDKPILEWGLTPFILGDLTKLALAAAVLPLAWHWLGRPKPAE